MKVLFKDFKKGFVKLIVESPEDLWYLSQIIEPEDRIQGKAERKIKLGNEGEKQKIIKKTMAVEIEAEKIDYSSSLKVLGKITKGPEDIPAGSHQSITVSKGDTITITKSQWLSFQINKLEESQQPKINILLVAFDREEAIFGNLSNSGIEVLSRKKGNVAKKDFENAGSNFYKELAKDIEEYELRLKPDQIIIASPSFWKEYLMKEIKDAKKIIQAGCSDVSENSLKEIIKRPELKSALEKSRSSQDEKRIEELMENIAKNLAFYGINEAKEKIEIGNVKVLFVSEKFMKEKKEKNNYKELEQLMKTAEKMGAELVIIGESQQLDGLGGIAGILRR